MYYLIINETPINAECEQKCLKVDSLSPQEPGLMDFMYQCCINFIADSASGRWVSDTDVRIDKLEVKDKAKWLLAECLIKGDFGDILKILRIEDDNEEM